MKKITLVGTSRSSIYVRKNLWTIWFYSNNPTRVGYRFHQILWLTELKKLTEKSSVFRSVRFYSNKIEVFKSFSDFVNYPEPRFEKMSELGMSVPDFRNIQPYPKEEIRKKLFFDTPQFYLRFLNLIWFVKSRSDCNSNFFCH